MKVGIYCRISREKGFENKSIQDQKMLGIEFCESNNFEYEVYIDEGLSGTIEDRPEFRRLLQNIVDGDINLIWVFDDSRIQRNPEIRFLINKHLRDFNVKYFTHIDGYFDVYNPQEELFKGIMAQFNKYFVELTKMKIKSVLSRRAKSGKGWGVVPYGYKLNKDGQYELDVEESEIVKEIYRLSHEGSGTERIARLLNERKVKTRYNKLEGKIRFKDKRDGKVNAIKKSEVKWAGNTIRGILNNPMFYGVKKINDVTFEVPALFDIKYWEMVNSNLKNKNRNTINKGGTKKYNYLLNKVISCGRCGKNYNGKTRPDKKDHFYYCMSKRTSHNCGNRSINIDKIESAVWHLIFTDNLLSKSLKRVFGESAKIASYHESIKKLNNELKELENKKSVLLDFVMQKHISFEEAQQKLNEIHQQIKSKKEELEKYQFRIKSLSHLTNPEELNLNSDFVSKMTHVERQSLIEKYLKDVRIFWLDEFHNSQKIRMYIIAITNRIENDTVYFINDYKLNLDRWVRIEFSKKNDRIEFLYKVDTKKGFRVENIPFLFDSKTGEIIDVIDTLVPFGNIYDWYEDDIEYYYGKLKYQKLKAELNYRRTSESIKKILTSTLTK